MDGIEQISEDEQDQLQLDQLNENQNIVSSSPIISSVKINPEKDDLNEFKLNIQIEEQLEEQSSQQQKKQMNNIEKENKKNNNRDNMHLLSSEEDIYDNINFNEQSDNKLSTGEQFIMQGLSNQDEQNQKYNSSGEKTKNEKQQIKDNIVEEMKLSSEDEFQFKKMNLSKSSEGSDIDDQKLQMMRKELHNQLYSKEYSSLFSHQKGDHSVDLKDLDDSDEETNDLDDFSNEKEQTNTWQDLQQFISSTGIYLYNEKKQIKKLLQKLESSYNDNILSNLTFREQFSRRKDYSLESKQYVPIILDTKYQVFRADNALKINLSIAKDYICDSLKYIQQNPTLLAQVITQLSNYRDFEISDLIENINNFLFENILDHTPSSKPLFKFLSEILKVINTLQIFQFKRFSYPNNYLIYFLIQIKKKEIANSKKVLDTFKMDSIYMKFIQGYTKRTNFQIFFSDSFKIPLYSIIKLNKIIKIDISKITNEDISYKRNVNHSHNHSLHQHHNSTGVSPLDQSLSVSSDAQKRQTSDKNTKVTISQDLDRSSGQNRTSTGLLNSFFSLFTDTKKKRNDSIADPTLSQNLTSQNCSSCNNMESESPLNLNSNDSGQNSQPKSTDNSGFDESEEDRAFIEERKQKEVDHNIKILKQITTQIIDSLTKHVSIIPKGIKIMCKMIVILLGERDPTLSLQDRLSVLSQFIIMRWVVPSLVSLLHRNTLTELHQLRYQNISIITKVLQKIFKKEHDNLNDYPGLYKLQSFIQGFYERTDQFFNYLLNFDDGFIQEIISKSDSELCVIKEDSITSLCVSFNDVDLILKIFNSVQDEKIKSQQKKLFAQVEKFNVSLLLFIIFFIFQWQSLIYFFFNQKIGVFVLIIKKSTLTVVLNFSRIHYFTFGNLLNIILQIQQIILTHKLFLIVKNQSFGGNYFHFEIQLQNIVRQTSEYNNLCI